MILKYGIILSILAAPAAFAIDVPATKKIPTEEIVQGIKIQDSYRWLENASDSDVVAWTAAQNDRTRAFIDKIPALAPLRSELEEWNRAVASKYDGLMFAGGQYFALKLQPPKNQAMLVKLKSLASTKSETVLVDPNTLNPKGTTAIDWFKPSLDGKRVAVSLSENGSEVGALRIVDMSGKTLSDTIPGVNGPTAGGSIAWNGDGTGFYYTRYPIKGERPDEDLGFYQQIYFHKIGTPTEQDRYELGKEFPKIAEIKLTTSSDGRYILAAVANGDGGEFAHYVLNSAGTWQPVTQFSDQCKNAWFGKHDDLYLLSLNAHPHGQILRLALSNLSLAKSEVLVPESAAVIEDVVITKNKIFVTDLLGGPSQIRMFNLAGKSEGTLTIPPVSSVSDLLNTTNDEVVFNLQSYTQPPTWYRYMPKRQFPQKTALEVKSPVSFADITVTREVAESKDHTKIPVTVLMKKGLKKDGKNPLLLTAYGGYGISLTPHFNADVHIWLEHGGIFAIANIRGGGEFGEEWHQNGNLTKKQNVFDDFIASAEHLIQVGYTNPKKLAITGRSNGGLLMGAALTQRPDLFAAVVSGVGIYDMIHVENDPNGTFNVTEFGTKADPDQFKALYAYSPLHHVSDGTNYPAVLLITGAHDGRVEPYHSKKMTARLQAASQSNRPILLRVNYDGGHGMGRSITQKVSEEADSYAFLFDQLGMRAQK